VPTPRGDYDGTIAAVAGLISRLEQELEARATVGVGIPGTIARETGLVKNSNSLWLNGRPLDKDFSAAMGRTVRCANDANCFALSEASDGAAAGANVVFGVIMGTGCGGGVAIGGRTHAGPNGIAGEWGHAPLPWMHQDEWPGPECYCGARGCIESWISGTGFARDYEHRTGKAATGEEIVAACARGEAEAVAAVERLEDRVARSLAMLIDILDPDVIVLGGGLSRLQRLYTSVPALLPKYVFGRSCFTPVRQAQHGDSSGVRGAAWLWSVEEARSASR